MLRLVHFDDLVRGDLVRMTVTIPHVGTTQFIGYFCRFRRRRNHYLIDLVHRSGGEPFSIWTNFIEPLGVVELLKPSDEHLAAIPLPGTE